MYLNSRFSTKKVGQWGGYHTHIYIYTHMYICISPYGCIWNPTGFFVWQHRALLALEWSGLCDAPLAREDGTFRVPELLLLLKCEKGGQYCHYRWELRRVCMGGYIDPLRHCSPRDCSACRKTNPALRFSTQVRATCSSECVGRSENRIVRDTVRTTHEQLSTFR